MSELAQESCGACRLGAPQLSDRELSELREHIPEWHVITVGGVPRLQRSFKFGNFVDALDFTNRVAELAEQYNHHPVITVEWGKAEVQWWTHKIGGLHRNDAVMAAKTDALLAEHEQ